MMQAPFDNIVQHLFHQPSLYSVTVDELENMARQHPYFAAAHFLLLKKMQDTSHPDFTAQLHKTTLYFNNPLWLQFLLQPETVSDFRVSDKSPFVGEEPVIPVANNNGHSATAIHETDASAVQSSYVDASAADTAVAVQDAPGETEPAEQGGIMTLISEVFSDPNPLYSPTTEPADAIIIDEAAANEKADSVAQEAEAIVTEEHQNTVSEIHPAGNEATETAMAIASPQGTTENTEQAATAYADRENISARPDFAPEPFDNNTTADAWQVLPEANADTTADADDTGELTATDIPVDKKDDAAAIETMAAKIAAGDASFNKTIIETPAAKSDILFEPYHTVDYFASQGIKLSRMEADGKDKLGRQLKSFTEWLKTMKKLPQVSINKILAENEESKVVEDANHSIEKKEVITEAMAEVFEKQGLQEEAADIYRKLSLLNPAKSAYFAARIEALKH